MVQALVGPTIETMNVICDHNCTEITSETIPTFEETTQRAKA